MEPGEGEGERYEMQLEIWTEDKSQDSAGHAEDVGFYSEYIRKALEDFRKSDMITRY